MPRVTVVAALYVEVVTVGITREGAFADARDVLLEAYRDFVASGKTVVELEDPRWRFSIVPPDASDMQVSWESLPDD